ncbi:hypothetical protein NDU88_002626 [Pleurodeles waltl]|uniref:Endonuclease/exonuclease/phosphatase domain-containing protein n=1 Tax=Pleurodeles waltl TaxID=8319 RepID=A0AAV7NMH9_PLEWA|nr:hypothetical protein NDU88_002626 [Pleurodeles waltl]
MRPPDRHGRTWQQRQDVSCDPRQLRQDASGSGCSGGSLKNLVTNKQALSFLQQFEIIMLQETWCMEPIQISGYSGILVSAKQPQRHGHPKGGLTTFCSTKINWVIKQIDLGIDWMIATKLELRAPSGNNRTLLLISVYIHLNKTQNSENMETLISILKMLQKQNKDAILILSGDFNLDLRKGSTKRPNGTCANIKFEILGLCCLTPFPEDASSAQITLSSGTKKSNIDFTLINETALPLVSAYRIQKHTESDHVPQLIKIRNEWNRLPIANIIISASVTYDTKELKWKGPGFSKVMEEVCRSAGTTKELKETLRTQEQEDHTQGERVIAWMYLCDSLINTFSIKKHLPILVIESKNKVKSCKGEKQWFNRTLRSRKNQVSRELKKVLKDIHWGRKSDDTRLSELRAKYKKNCWMAKQSYHEDLWTKMLMSNKQKNNKMFWELINGLTQGKNRHTNAGIDAATWESHVQTIFSLPEHHVKEAATQIANDLSMINFGFRVTTQTDLPLNENEGKHALMTIDIVMQIRLIKKLKMEGAAGQNGIPNALFRGDPSFWAHYLVLLFNVLQGTTGLPDAWKCSIIYPIYKAGNPAKPSNYRLKALINVEAKLYASCLLQQLAEWIHDRHLIPQCQTGFRAGTA